MPSPLASSRLWLTALCAAAFAVAGLAGCGDSDSGESAGTPAPAAETEAAEAEGTEATEPEAASASTAEGEAVFKQANCSSCHQLAAAGAEGRIGPNLDEVRPSADEVKRYVIEGPGSMPSFEGQLSDEEIQAVSDYVAAVAGS